MDNNKKNIEGDKDAALKPDPETLNTTDPQEHMEGPVSSSVQSVKETTEELTNDVSKEEADAKKDEKM